MRPARQDPGDRAAETVQQLLDRHPIGSLQWRVVALCFIVAILDGFDMQAMAFAGPAVSDALQFEPGSLGPALSASLAGLMVGAMTLGSLADRIGRKPVIVIACLVMALFSGATALASSMEELIVLRFLTGIGIGGAMPSLNALTSDYAPSRSRAVLMTLMFVGVPMGNLIGGVAAAPLIAHFGWQAIFIAGAVAPLMVVPVLLAALPESMQVLLRNGQSDRAARLASSAVRGQVLPHELRAEDALPRTPIASLLAGPMKIRTILLWVVFFSNLFVTFSFLSWIPSILRLAGQPMEVALYVAAAAGIGGIAGGLLIAWLADRYGYHSVLLAAAVVSAAVMLALGPSLSWLPLTVAAVIAAGASVGGLQFGLQALAAHVYPPPMRSTGLGMALGIGRLGAIGGPLAVGTLLSSEMAASQVLALLALPCLVSGSILLLLSRLEHPVSAVRR